MKNQNTQPTPINKNAAEYEVKRVLDGAARDLVKIETATEQSGRRGHGGKILGVPIGRQEIEVEDRNGNTRRTEVAAVASAVKYKDGKYGTTVRLMDTDPNSPAHENGVPGEVAHFNFYPQEEGVRGGAVDRGHEHAVTNPNAALAQILGTKALGDTVNPAELMAIAEGVQNSETVLIQQPGRLEELPLGDIIPQLHRTA